MLSQYAFKESCVDYNEMVISENSKPKKKKRRYFFYFILSGILHVLIILLGIIIDIPQQRPFIEPIEIELRPPELNTQAMLPKADQLDSELPPELQVPAPPREDHSLNQKQIPQSDLHPALKKAQVNPQIPPPPKRTSKPELQAKTKRSAPHQFRPLPRKGEGITVIARTDLPPKTDTKKLDKGGLKSGSGKSLKSAQALKLEQELERELSASSQKNPALRDNKPSALANSAKILPGKSVKNPDAQLDSDDDSEPSVHLVKRSKRVSPNEEDNDSKSERSLTEDLGPQLAQIDKKFQKQLRKENQDLLNRPSEEDLAEVERAAQQAKDRANREAQARNQANALKRAQEQERLKAAEALALAEKKHQRELAKLAEQHAKELAREKEQQQRAAQAKADQLAQEQAKAKAEQAAKDRLLAETKAKLEAQTKAAAAAKAALAAVAKARENLPSSPQPGAKDGSTTGIHDRGILQGRNDGGDPGAIDGDDDEDADADSMTQIRGHVSLRNPTIALDPSKDAAGKSSAGNGIPTGYKSLSAFRQMPGNPVPQYSDYERLHRMEGRVVYLAWLNGDGSLSRYTKVKSSGHASLDEKSLEFLKKWRFYRGQTGWVEVPFEYQLKGDPQQMAGALRVPGRVNR